MNINITLFGQMITFAIFVFVTMKFIWPNLNKALEDREHKIMQGLQAAEKGQQKLKMAEDFVKRKEAETKLHCAQLLMEAKHQAEKILESAIIQANDKKKEIIASGNTELEKKHFKLVQDLKKQLATLITLGAEKILDTHLDDAEHNHIILDISNKLYGTK